MLWKILVINNYFSYPKFKYLVLLHEVLRVESSTAIGQGLLAEFTSFHSLNGFVAIECRCLFSVIWNPVAKVWISEYSELSHSVTIIINEVSEYRFARCACIIYHVSLCVRVRGIPYVSLPVFCPRFCKEPFVWKCIEPSEVLLNDQLCKYAVSVQLFGDRVRNVAL
jgi:hypothetical protein